MGHSQLALIPRTAGGYCSQYGIWAPGTVVRTQEDYAINLSPSAFSEFIKPCTARIVRSFEWQIVHTHSGTRLAEWISDIPGLAAIEIAYDPNGPAMTDLIPRLQTLSRQIPVILLGSLTQRQIDTIAHEVPAGGLWLDVDIVPEGADVNDHLWVER